jgi:hypothetical protein
MATKTLSPEKAIGYCEIVLSELALNPLGHNSYVEFGYVRLDIMCISMPHIEIDGVLTDGQVARIRNLIADNEKSAKYKFAGLYRSRQLKFYQYRNSQAMSQKQYAWRRVPENMDRSYEDSPLGVLNSRLSKAQSRLWHKMHPGYNTRFYGEYLASLWHRLNPG